MFKVKEAEKEKRVVGNTRYDLEFQMLSSEIPRMASLNHHLRRQNSHSQLMSVPPVGSSSFPGGLYFSEDGFSPSVARMDRTMNQTPSTHYIDSRVVKKSNESMLDKLGLCENFCRMNFREAREDCSKITRVPVEPDGLGLSGCSLDGMSPYTLDNYGAFEGFSSDFHGYEGFQPTIPGNSVMSSNDDKLLGLWKGHGGNLRGSHLTHNHSDPLYSEPCCYKERMNYVMDQRNQQGRGSCNGELHVHDSSFNRPYLNDEMCCSPGRGVGFNGDKSFLNPVNSSQLVYHNLALSVGSPICSSSSMSREKTRANPNGRVPSPLLSMTDGGGVETFSCEDSLIIQGKNLKYVLDKGCDSSKGQKKFGNEIAIQNLQEKRQDLFGQSQLQRICEKRPSPRSYGPLPFHPTFGSLAQVQGHTYFMAKDQLGCRFLQRIFDEGTYQDVQLIFNEIIDHVAELMVNSFGNYLVQKLLEVCSEDQRTQIVLVATEQPGELVRISLNTHGTRVVQKLIETLKTRKQISLVVSALEPGFLDLIKDLNGNHVIQRCLQCLGKEDNKFMFDAAAKFCIDIATHQHGCCVLNRCIAQSVGRYREKLVAEISAHGLLLAQDAFGNYVVQYLIELKIPSVAASLISQFEGRYVYLSTQKFSSHVVEKCLKYFEENRPRIIHELLSVPHFEQLLQDPYANYVIQSALEVSKGTLHASLVEAVRPHAILRTSPYCKKIFSRSLLKR